VIEMALRIDMGHTLDKFQGNCDLGECFCDVKCRHGHKTRLCNLGRGHNVACDTCRTYIFVGVNLVSC